MFQTIFVSTSERVISCNKSFVDNCLIVLNHIALNPDLGAINGRNGTSCSFSTLGDKAIVVQNKPVLK